MSYKNLVLCLALTLLATLAPTRLLADPHTHIAITQIVQHEAADKVREGILDALREGGFEEGVTAVIHYENAQGNPTIAAQIARKFAGQTLDIILPITTTSAQTVMKAQMGQTTPMVFAAVTDPVAAGLVKTLDTPSSTVTGLMDMPPIKEQMAFIKTLTPGVKKLGVLYNPGDEGSTASLKIIRQAAQAQGFEIIESPASRSIDVKSAVVNLVGRVDALYVPLDNTFVSAMRTVSQLALHHKLPLYAADSGSVTDGALACLGYSYYEHGKEAGQLAVRILKGESPKDIPVRASEKKTVYINTQAAKVLGIEIPKAIASKAELL